MNETERPPSGGAADRQTIAAWVVGIAVLAVAATWWLHSPREATDEGAAFDAREPGDAEAATRAVRRLAEQANAADRLRLDQPHADGLGLADGDLDELRAAQAVAWLREPAQRGHPVAQRWLGSLYATGTDVAEDDAQAVAWFRKAAEQGDAPAQAWLGVMHFNGDGVAKDDAQAAAWFRKAAEQGDASAQNWLGWMYEAGLGVPEDRSRAYAWTQLAAAQDFAPAVERMSRLRASMTSAQLAEAQRLSRSFKDGIQANR